jgi:hypothetical protein
MTAYPTPRGWERVDRCLKFAGNEPSKVAGQPTPASFFQTAASLVGHPAAIKFTSFVTKYTRVLIATDVLDNWDVKKKQIKKASHDEIVALIDKIGDHCAQNEWNEDQMKNLTDFAAACCTGEDYLNIFKVVTTTKNIRNIQLFHSTPMTAKVRELANNADNMKKNL